jgi:hypothetical protein
MPTTYTDVDRLIFQRWDDTLGLLEAYEELQDRIHEVITDVGQRLSEWGVPQGYIIDTDAKIPSFYAYRNTWLNRRRDDALVYFSLEHFAPLGYRRAKENHPAIWVYTENLQMLRMKEPDRVQFAKDLRTSLGDLAAQWKHEDSHESEYPLGTALTDISDSDRVRLVSDPEALVEFATSTFKKAFVLSDGIEKTLSAAKARD